MKKYDVIIIGGGTAGLMLARELGKQKHATLILDRKTNLLEFSFNTLGSFMKVEDFGLSENVIAQKIDSGIIHSKSLKENIKLEACILDKKIVHQELLESLHKDFVDIVLDVHIKNIVSDSKENYTSITDKNGNVYKASIFVDASGTNGVFSKKVGLTQKKPALAVGVEYNVKYLGKVNEAHLMIGKDYKGGYGWIFPLKNNRAIIGFGSFDESMVKGLKDKLNSILELPKIKALVLKDNENVEGGSIPITPVLDKFVDKNLVCVGDSVSQVNPIVGEGYKFIFEAAIMASKAIDKALKNNDLSLLFEYEDNWKNRFLSNYKRSKIAQTRIFKLSKKDFLTDIGMILLKLRSNKKNVQTLSGEYN
ncbi:NAD(P)/FAD-dependent oxidoreductase [Polaribacter batillariae]|uniref:NAD(P)/FAD-dependent oxidoreductase n=1 Tax=Polaribacter batillariae TaxID=2808900 RepID=A0ABX7SY31_9FLAO|nr:NAD(P)/FAD-dependent oxidoreductase [Polaribacter batillariae]QTD39172.1 NAD(P)/FAD-dependent oxidoreductase [Polaribacter batillariae]